MRRLLLIALVLCAGCAQMPTGPRHPATDARTPRVSIGSPAGRPPYGALLPTRGGSGTPASEPVGAPNSILLQTLHAVGGRTLFQLGSVQAYEIRVDSAGGTRDARDLTRDEARSDGSGFDPEGCTPPSLAYEVGYSFEPATTNGVIDFVRLHVRARRSGYLGTGEWGIVQGLVEGMGTMGVPVQLDYRFWTNASWDYPVDWRYGLPWTTAMINDAKFGFDLTINGTSCEDYITGSVSEITLEIWGQPVGPLKPPYRSGK